MIGVEIVDERKPADHMGSLPADGQLAAAIQAACFNNKLLLEKGGRNGTVIRLLCPLSSLKMNVLKRLLASRKQLLKHLLQLEARNHG
jgi:4-aminobutyrate aminotransferase-like enzyme